MKYSIQDILDSMPKEKTENEPYITRLYRFISYGFVWICVNVGISANTISVVSVIDAIVGSIVISLNSPLCRILGTILLCFWVVLDAMDGEIARTTKTSSYMGEFFDAIGGYSIFAFGPIGVSVAAYNTTSFIENKSLFIIMGGVSAVTGLFSRLIYQKYIHSVNNAYLKMGKPILSTESSRDYLNVKKDFNYYRKKIDLLVGTAGYYFPILVFSLCFNCFDIMCLLYSFYFIFGFIGILALYLIRAKLFAQSELKL